MWCGVLFVVELGWFFPKPPLSLVRSFARPTDTLSHLISTTCTVQITFFSSNFESLLIYFYLFFCSLFPHDILDKTLVIEFQQTDRLGCEWEGLRTKIGLAKQLFEPVWITTCWFQRETENLLTRENMFHFYWYIELD